MEIWHRWRGTCGWFELVTSPHRMALECRHSCIPSPSAAILADVCLGSMLPYISTDLSFKFSLRSICIDRCAAQLSQPFIGIDQLSLRFCLRYCGMACIAFWRMSLLIIKGRSIWDLQRIPLHYLLALTVRFYVCCAVLFFFGS